MSLQVVTANRLDDGLAVFMTADEGWSTDIRQAVCAEDAEQAEALLARANTEKQQITVVGPYLIDVAHEDGVLAPTKYREVLRTLGPSVRTDLGYQAG
ncbi:DUF2849 domain-containing protein [Thalassospira sp. TSL5-1]|uniref:DUF2849 domain-containing protein n=1 Tax=Thalassospira sp. TSL5-1 TaxID=1544451 RepID=UPI00093D4D30|nr:DUF2849 domain-containing protein [Thalassospira sp. TSL5-1]OKH87030.1 hypothetical protein LF95_18720 [Thalassospira sp. TSL5-1]